MPLSTTELLDALTTVTSIPVVPFRDGEIDYQAHTKNIDYLMNNNYLDGGRRRVIGIAGTSLIHHITAEDQIELFRFTGERMGGRGVLMAGIAPNPIGDAGQIVAAQSKAEFPPDVFLLMPLTGVGFPEGIYQQYMEFGERYGSEYGARFLYYMRQKEHVDTVVRLLNDSPHFIGVKIGTSPDEVEPIRSQVDLDNNIVIWGVGDRSTAPAQRGTTGHTSGINVAFVRASDEINNAQRRGDFATSQKIEDEVAPLEEIRFRDGRAYNYSAVVEAMRLCQSDAIDGGTGGPFNPLVPPEVRAEVEAAVVGLKHYH